MDRAARARELIDAAHAADPARAADGRPAELVYAERIEAWVRRLHPAAEELLLLAARCQHLERFTVPRGTFPEGKAGYHAWRRSLYARQAARCAELLAAAGYPSDEAARAGAWVAKEDLKSDPGSQALEDAACLVFLENEIVGFAARHADYPRAKWVDILRKTWRKMSPAAQAAALTLPCPSELAGLLAEARSAARP